MEDLLLKLLTSPESIIAVGPALLLLAYIAYKEWPELKKRVSAGTLKEKELQEVDESLAGEILQLGQKMQDADKALEDKIIANEDDIRELKGKMLGIEQKLANDFASINILKRENDQMRRMAESSLEERRILMECNLALLKAVRELGANGPTGVKEAEEMLQGYLNRMAHNLGL